MMTQFSTLAYFANWRTRLIYFILLPVNNLALLFLINDQYGTGFQWQIVIATVCIDATTLTLQAMAQLLVTDARLGIDVELITKAPANAYYWATKVATALLAGATLAAVNLVGGAYFGGTRGRGHERDHGVTGTAWCRGGGWLYRLEPVVANEESVLLSQFFCFGDNFGGWVFGPRDEVSGMATSVCKPISVFRTCDTN
ncbi:hypothetical protein [Furfurilactobacillus entadae]|uniref:hypothetical protein n=1 Tax=Furfurilactobacillus entadae TaxID=2922307 RepID=UPI0035E5FA48